MEEISSSVMMDRGASAEEIEAVRRVFSEVGVQATIRASYAQLSELPPWMVMALLPLTAFLTGLGAEAGKDAYQRLKGLVKALHAARAASRQPPGNVVLEDADSHAQIALSPKLPDEAFRKLFDLDVDSLPSGPVHFDVERGEWFSFRLKWEAEKQRKRETPPRDAQP